MTYDFVSSPRVANIPDGAGDVTVEDLWDTLSEEAAKVENLDKKKFINRPLGGGRATLSPTKDTGITLVLDNMVLKFPDQAGPGYVIKRVVDGNLIAIDSGGSPIEPLVSSDFTNWKNEADVSGVILNAAALDATAFVNGAVWIDSDVGTAGTAFPLGTPTSPVDNVEDARTIALANNLRTLMILSGDLTFYLPTSAFDTFNILNVAREAGGVPGWDGNGATHANTKFQAMNLIGDFGSSFIRPNSCTIQGVSEVHGDFANCDIVSEIAAPLGLAFPQMQFTDCAFRDFGVPAINFTTSTFGFMRINGGTGVLSIRNMADANHSLIIDGFSGRLIIEASCTAGTITARGDIDVVDASAGTTVNKTGSTRIQILKKLLTRNFWLGNR